MMNLKNSVFRMIPFLILAASAHADLEANKKIVVDFYDLAFNQHRPTDAALKYLSEGYVQHNPYVATGRQAFIDAFAGEKDDTSKAIFKQTIAEKDLVVLHSHKVQKTGDRGVAGIDIFRVKDGKITEHWDVNQKIPEGAKNPMF
jgi:predicted SnoaL-like aldol condensation-catalyzing enzyme